MSVSVSTGVITFTYTSTTILEKVKELTARTAQVMFTEKNPAPLVDQFAVSDDEENTVLIKMKEAAGRIFQNFSKLTYGVTAPVTLADANVILKIVDNAGYNPGTPTMIDSLMEEAIVDYVVSAWFAMKKISDQSNFYFIAYNSCVKDLVNLSFELRLVA